MHASKERLLKDLRQVVRQTEALLEAGGEKLGDTRAAVVQHLETARDSLVDLEHELKRSARQTVRRVDHYAEDNPWQLASVGLVVGLVLGALLALGAHRRN